MVVDLLPKYRVRTGFTKGGKGACFLCSETTKEWRFEIIFQEMG